MLLLLCRVEKVSKPSSALQDHDSRDESRDGRVQNRVSACLCCYCLKLPTTQIGTLDSVAALYEELTDCSSQTAARRPRCHQQALALEVETAICKTCRTILELVRDMATDLVEDGAKVKVCVQQALGQGVFQVQP